MLYSGADLIRTSGQQHERIERLRALDSVQPVAAPDNPTSNLDEQTHNALERFARFIHKEGKKPPKPSQNKKPGRAANPYDLAEAHAAKLFGHGHTLDIYV